ncbi:MAG: ATP-binding protein [Candidatus Hydrogenedentota bacterium]
MIDRHMEKALVTNAHAYPVLTVTGPRQSGKTTLVRKVFPNHDYVSLENPDERSFAQEDPRGFLNRFQEAVILDEVQRVPELLSYVQGRVDEDDRMGRYILTGSQNFLLLEKVSQSLAGRTALFQLLPFSRAELAASKPMALDEIGCTIPKRPRQGGELSDVLFRGFYPRIHDKGLAPQDWLRNYYQTYIERDVRSIVQVGDIETFGRFVRLCAGRAGQILNLSSLGADCGISHATARRWLSVLEASYIVYLLRPHYENFSKRLIKSPKLYFIDTGLLCYLLRIRSAEELVSHALRGAIFETFVLVELLKTSLNQGMDPDVYFWRDVGGHEVDFVLDQGRVLVPVEAKSGETIASDYLKGIEFWRGLPGQEKARAAVVYGGEASMMRTQTVFYSWRDWL